MISYLAQLAAQNVKLDYPFFSFSCRGDSCSAANCCLAFTTTTITALVAVTTTTLQNVLMRPAARPCWLHSGIKSQFLQQIQNFDLLHLWFSGTKVKGGFSQFMRHNVNFLNNKFLLKMLTCQFDVRFTKLTLLFQNNILYVLFVNFYPLFLLCGEGDDKNTGFKGRTIG